MSALGFTPQLPGYYPSLLKSYLQNRVSTTHIEVKIYAVFYKQMVVEWNIPDSWGDCSFNIYRGEDDYGPWVKLTPGPIFSNFFKDTTTQDFSKFQNGYYIVEVVLPSGQIIQSKAVTIENKRSTWVDIRAREIQRREILLLTKFTGVASFVFRRKNFGQRCSNCWNSDIEKVTQDHCPVCLGTSFQGGYFPGFGTLFQYDTTPNDAQLSYQGKVEQNALHAWTISKPDLQVFDLILRVPDWRLFRIDHIDATELQTKQVRQIATLTELGKNSVEFNLAFQAMPPEYSV